MEDEGTKIGMEVVVFVPAPSTPTLEDEPHFEPLDLTTDPMFSLLRSPWIDLNQDKYLCNSGYISPNAKSRPLGPTTKSLIRGY